MNLLTVACVLVITHSSSPMNATTCEGAGKREIVEEDLVYARADGVDLQAHSYRPIGRSPELPAAIDIHGGAWSFGGRMDGQLYDRALAASGMYILAIDFRQAPKFRHPAASRDINAAIRFLRANSQRLNIQKKHIGLIGSSSGGHLAMLAGLLADAKEFAGTSIAMAAGKFEMPTGIDASVEYVVALWPVSDPAYRYDFARRAGRSDLVKAQEAYFGTRDQMSSASVTRVLREGRAGHVPPLLIVQPGKDANIPREMTSALISAYQDAAGHVEYLYYPEQPHLFGLHPSNDTDDLVCAMRAFIGRRL